MRHILLSKYSHPIFSIIPFSCHYHLISWDIIHTHLKKPAYGEAHHFRDSHDGPFSKEKRSNFHGFDLFSLAVYVYLFHFTNLIFWCSFLSWTLPYCPIDVRLVLLHITGVKTPLQCWLLDIFAGSYSYLRDLEVPLVLSSFRLCYLAHTVDVVYNYLHKHWLYWGDLSFLTTLWSSTPLS